MYMVKVFVMQKRKSEREKDRTVPTFPCPSSEMYVLTYTRSNSSSTCEISNSVHIAVKT